MTVTALRQFETYFLIIDTDVKLFLSSLSALLTVLHQSVKLIFHWQRL